MGGSVMVVIREEDGTVHAQERWTNTLIAFALHPRFFAKDKEYIRQYLSRWESEWGFDGAGMRSFLAPHDYGLVVFDFQQDKLLSMQGYGEFGVAYTFNNAQRGNPSRDRLMEAGRLTNPQKYTWGTQYDVDMHPFQLSTYPEFPEDIQRMRIDIESLGFQLTRDDRLKWWKFLENE